MSPTDPHADERFAWLFKPFGNLDGFPPRLPVSDLGRSRHFYVEVLACEVESESEWEIEISGAFQARLSFIPQSVLPEGARIAPSVMMVFTRDLRELADHFAGLGLKFREPLEINENGKAGFCLEDPDGHRLQFSGPP